MIELTLEQADAILDYLMERPAKETMNAIVWISQAKAAAAETTSEEEA